MVMIVNINLNTILPIGIMILIAIVFSMLYLWYVKGYMSDIKSGKADIELLDEFIYDNLSHVKKRKKTIKTINSLVFYGFLIVMTPIFIFSISNKLTGNISNVGDKGLLAVSSGSMSFKHPVNEYLDENNLNNQFNTYDLIIVETVENEDDLKPFDVIVFLDNNGKLTIHRIIEINLNENGVNEYITRGDSNNTNDTFVSTFKDIKGKYTDERIPFIGAFVLFFQSLMGIITVVILICCIMIFDNQNNKILIEKQNRLEKFKDVEIINIINHSPFVTKLFYKGYMYLFNEKGFVSRDDVAQENEYYEKSLNTVIKVCEDTNLLVTYYQIDERE